MSRLIKTLNRRHWIGLVAASGFTLSAPVRAQGNYPDHPIKMIVPFATGGAMDVLGRVLANALRAEFNQQVIVDNRTGATGHIGGEAAARSAADGYTLLLTASSAQAVSLHLLKLNYKPMEDLVPVALVATASNLVVVTKDLPVQSMADLIAYAKANPGKISYGSYGLGSNSHLSCEMIGTMAGVELVHIPYSSPQMMPDLIAGRIQLLVATAGEVEQHMKAGTVRAIANTSPGRLPQFPQLPPVADTLPGYVVNSWGMLMAPAKTPPEILAKLNAACVKVLSRTDVQETLSKLGLTASKLSVAQTREYLRTESARWERVVREAKVPMLN